MWTCFPRWVQHTCVITTVSHHCYCLESLLFVQQCTSQPYLPFMRSLAVSVVDYLTVLYAITTFIMNLYLQTIMKLYHLAENLKQNFTHLLSVYMHAKLQNFIQLSLNWSKLHCIKTKLPSEFLHFTSIWHFMLFDNKQQVKARNLVRKQQILVRTYGYHMFRLSFTSWNKTLQNSLISFFIDPRLWQSLQIYCSALLNSRMVLGFGWSLQNTWSELRSDEF